MFRKWSVMLVGWIATALWLLIAVLIVVPRWNDLATAPADTIGDTLSGFVAPLAFLWLIVATWLQRQELSLQRKELEETRQVLADQQRELENTAKENAEQTRIMQQTFQTSREHSVFEEHKLRLYYLAQYIHTVVRSQSLLLNDSNGQQFTVSLYDQPGRINVQENLPDVDGLLVDFAGRQHIIQEKVLAGQPFGGDAVRMRNAKVCETARYLQTEAEILGTSEQYLNNPLVAARLKGIEFEWILENIRNTVRVLFARPL
ncbi:hypothetical protein ACD578_28440 (plasmid) [Microvirga sp. RSM25]|uniref:hypothetical protein n=1 Tax=Microvirga sp. RSM25 TaxID=3273802 RepID=UPI00384E67BE